MVRRHTVLTLALAAPLLAACSDDPGIVSDADDLDAAVAVWSDPWVAPTSATVAGPALGSNGQVSRVVGRRTTTYATDVEAAVRIELRSAAEAGWAPTSSTCGDSVQVALVGPHDAVAQLVVTPDGDATDAALQAVTPHHLDQDWRVPDPAPTTCVDGESPTFTAPPIQSAPLGDQDSDDVTAEWSGDGSDDDAVAAANSDPGLAAVGLEVAETRLEGGVNRRRPPAAEVDVATGSLAALADELTGWRLTYATCGGDAPTRATFYRSIDGSSAVVSASLIDGSAEVRVTLTMAQGPGGDWLSDLDAVDPTLCADPGTLAGTVTSGIPAVLPTELTPIAAD